MMNKHYTNENTPAVKRASMRDTLSGAALFCFAPLCILAMYLLAALAH